MMTPEITPLGRVPHAPASRFAARPSSGPARLRPTPLLVAVCTLLLSGAVAGTAAATVPPMINYQAYLTDEGGTPVSGTVGLEFAIFDSSAAGTALWMEAHPAVVIQEGVFGVLLGSVTSLESAIFDEANRWLETRVDGLPMTPRRPFVSVPYALRAQVAETALTGGGDGAWVVNGAHVYRPDGNVGVGTSAPTERFHAVSPLFARLLLERTGGSIVKTDASLTSGSVGTTSAHPFRLLTGNSVRLTVDTDGEIGIGTTTPDGKLDVRGSGGQDLFNLYEGGTNVMSVVSGGKVGIGTNAPDNTLHVVGNTSRAIYGAQTGAGGTLYGVFGESNSITGVGVRGQANHASGLATGVHGQAVGSGGTGVLGESLAGTGTTYGVVGRSSSSGGYGVHAASPANVGLKADGGVTGVSAIGGNTGIRAEGGLTGIHVEGGDRGGTVYGNWLGLYVEARDTTVGQGIGIFGGNQSPNGAGIMGASWGPSGTAIWGHCSVAGRYAIRGTVVSDEPGWAGYFEGGPCYMQQSVGIGTETPAFTLHVNGTAGKPGGGSWSVASDERLKTNVHPLHGSLESLCKVETVTYEYIDPASVAELPGVRTGVIAQQVETIFPDWVEEGADGYKRVTFRGFEALAISALRELRAEKDTQIARLRAEHEEAIAQVRAEKEAEIDALRAGHAREFQALAQRLTEIERRVAAATTASAAWVSVE